MSTMVEDEVTIPAASIKLDPSVESDWARALLEFVTAAGENGRSVRVLAEEKSYAPSEAARIARVSRATIQRRIADGTIKASKRGSYYRIAESELERYVRGIWLDTMSLLAANDDF